MTQVTTPPPAPEEKAAKLNILSRRDFITLLLGGGATMVLAATLAQPLDTFAREILQDRTRHPHEGDSNYRWGMVIDLSKCIGCDYCVWACQATNDTADDMRWNIRIDDTTPVGSTFHLTRPCLHCQHAPCVSVCPVGATYVRADGIVAMDYAKCIGCRYCQTACPYGARQFNWLERSDVNTHAPEWGEPEVPRRPRGVVEKCTFCVHRIDAGLAAGLMPGVDEAATPACVNVCPVQARFFGNLNDPNSRVSQIIASVPTLRLREDLGTDPNVYYIPPEGLV
ncbi:MAG: 4Fe-4S dicluster domain-containing protein [Anaerolinea sp.]|nr:4Fe-4S dicluster domain-containing protein [Anaerolinea sp.]